MKVYAFSGVTRTGDKDVITILRELEALEPPDEVVTGAAVGVDSIVAFHAFNLWPAAHHVIMVPAARHSESIKHWARTKPIEIIHCEPRPSAAAAYMERNLAMAKRCSELHAFPRTAAPIQRSGTWATIRRAEMLGKPVHLHPLGF
jgi:hypothetical protein